MLEEFFKDLNAAWEPQGSEPHNLYVIGNASLWLQGILCGHRRIIDLADLKNNESQQSLPLIAGPRSKLSKKHHFWMEYKKSSDLFLPKDPIFFEHKDLNVHLNNLKIFMLDPLDVLISKLNSFRADEVQEIHDFIDQHEVDVPLLTQRFQSAILSWNDGKWQPAALQFVEHLHQVERDFLGVQESAISLPSHIDALKHV